jgi:D-xylulose reductase
VLSLASHPTPVRGLNRLFLETAQGTIVRLGSNVTSHKLGDRVALEPGKACGLCPICTSGKYELCPKMRFAATPPYTRGTLCRCVRLTRTVHMHASPPSDLSCPSASRYYTLPANLAHPLPESISFDEGAMIEPLAVGVHSVGTLANVRPGQTIAIFGAGPVGLLAAAVAKALGAKRVIVVGASSPLLLCFPAALSKLMLT